MHEKAVLPELLALLRQLMGHPELENFALGGGTSLALRFGHRSSVDIDLFSPTPFDSTWLQNDLHGRYPTIKLVNRTPGSLCAVIGGIKLDVLLHSYPELFAPQNLEGIRMVSLPDLAAMKINAITNRGSKKDFSDLLLLQESGGLAVAAALDHFCAKYGPEGRFLALRSLIWFDDAEDEPDPQYLNGWTWQEVRRRMETIGNALYRLNGI